MDSPITAGKLKNVKEGMNHLQYQLMLKNRPSSLITGSLCPLISKDLIFSYDFKFWVVQLQ